ncbi:MAG: ATP-dependent DNA helicase UvrD2, partial [Nitriliruptoraceae bacterium]
MTTSTPPSTPFPGPLALGRGVVVRAGVSVPDGMDPATPRVRVDTATLGDPAETVTRLHRHWLRREPVVIDLDVDADELRTPTVTTAPAHEVGVDHSIDRDRLAFLVWANNHDARDGTPVWWHGVLAARRTSARPAFPDADVELADGTRAWVDGGPRGPVDGVTTVHRESLQVARPQLQAMAEPAATPDAGPPRISLAADQQGAVDHTAGPARVIAPAGSGKTRVLTQRILTLLGRGIEPELVTAVAYNTRAADELRNRLATPALSVRTLNSFGLWICSIEERRQVVTERDVRSLLSEHVRVGRVPNQDPWQAWIDALSEARLGLRDPQEVEASRDDVDGFTDVFDAYRRTLAERRLLDFDEQILRAVELLLARPDLRARVQRACTHLLVDEFQDLTPAHLLLIRLAAGPSMQLFAVGDDDQTIYGYAGATPRWLVDFDDWFPGAASLALETNHRCPVAVVTAADLLLSHNRLRVDKTILAADTAVADPDALTVHRVPASDTVDVTLDLLNDGSPGDCAVLTRVASVLLPVQVALADAGVPNTAPLEPTVLERTGLRTALAYLRIAAEPDHVARRDLLDTVNRPTRKIRTAVDAVLRRSTVSLSELRRLRRDLDASHRDRFDAYVTDLRGLATAVEQGASTAECLRVIREDIGLGAAMESLDRSQRRPEGSSHLDDLDALEQVAAREPDPRTFEAWVRSLLARPGDPDGITLSTIHRVKGLEWDHVVVFGVNAGLFPHRRADDVEEERRILHVALTRGRRRVDVVADEQRCSPFLDQMTRRAPVPTEPEPSRRVQRAPAGSSTASTPATLDERAPRRPGVDGRSDDELFDQLRDWRRTTARRLEVPPFLIFHDRHLHGIAAARPGTLTELAACPGVGPQKLERFGDEVLAVTR